MDNHDSYNLAEALLEARNLVGGYGKQTILQDVSLSLHKGEWLSLVGANGSGKSTLLKLC
ncbi:MAG: ATP-binding cassette domain-containing protein, partial [Pseudanabaena sp.]